MTVSFTPAEIIVWVGIISTILTGCAGIYLHWDKRRTALCVLCVAVALATHMVVMSAFTGVPFAALQIIKLI